MTKFLVGFALIFLVFIESLILSKRKTTPVILLDMSFFSLIAIILSLWNIVPAAAFVLLLLFKKNRDKWYDDKPAYNYQEEIYSVSRLSNELFKNNKQKNEVTIGKIRPVNFRDISNNHKYVNLNDQVMSGGMLITGSTGSGKTTTIMSIINQRAMQKRPIVFVDYKGEPEILDRLKALSEKLNIPYYEFSARDCNFSYDPFVNLNETGIVEALLNTRRWDSGGADEHYKTSTQLLIQNVVRAYEKHKLETRENKHYIKGLYDFMQHYKPDGNERDGYNTLIKQLEIILTSKAKEMFNSDKEQFSFMRDDQYIIVFSFVSSNKALANSLSSFIFQDLMHRGTIKQYNPKLALCVDEFGTLENSTVIKDILEKGRSGGIQTVFSILDINQIAMTSGDHFVNAILGTINTLVLHAGATSQTAEIMGGVSKYDIENDIMSLEKPQDGRPPTALIISKFRILNKRGSQEIHRIVPYSIDVKANDRKPTAGQEQAQVVEQAIEPEVVEQPVVFEEAKQVEEPVAEQSKAFNVNDYM